MDYRDLQEKYGSKLTQALSDQKFIDWLITVLQDEGFGDAKTTNLLDGTNIDVVKTAEDSSSVTYRIDFFASNNPEIEYSIDEGLNHEWGKQIAISGLNVDITITRRTYALDSVLFTDLSEADKDRAAIDAAGVNANVGVSDYAWILPDINNDLVLTNGDTLVGSLVATDEKGYAITKQIIITRQDRYIWGISQGIETPSNIATQLASVTGNIVPADDDANFLSVTTGLGTFPTFIDVDTAGINRTLFIATIDSSIEFKLESDIPFPISAVNESVNLNSISSGDANVARSYHMRTIDLNTNFTLYKQ